MSTTGERVTRLETKVDQMEQNFKQHVIRMADAETKIADLQTAKSNVVFAAWVANGITCLFVAILAFVGTRLVNAEAAEFKRQVIQEVREAKAIK